MQRLRQVSVWYLSAGVRTRSVWEPGELMGGCGNLSFCEEASAPVTWGSSSAVTRTSLSFSSRPNTLHLKYTHTFSDILTPGGLRVLLRQAVGAWIAITFTLKSLAKETDIFWIFPRYQLWPLLFFFIPGADVEPHNLTVTSQKCGLE